MPSRTPADVLSYQTGFGNYFSTEAVKGALPIGRNSPQKPALGLYAEQLSGSAFTAQPHENLRSWLYRLIPQVDFRGADALALPNWQSQCDPNIPVPSSALRWDALTLKSKEPVDFIAGIYTYAVAGDVRQQSGSAIHYYECHKNMSERALINADGDFLIVPQAGALLLRTEFGHLQIEVGEIGCIPRGIAFAVDLVSGAASGYICENYGAHFQLPYRGPIGANGLANTRDFEYPVAKYEEHSGKNYQLVRKFLGHFYAATAAHSPFDVVAWHGNYAPFKYDLRKFNTMNTVSYDHADPSIFTVLTSPGIRTGVANIDFVIFPPRWSVAEDTFRPPWYHRNIMSEFMGLLYGSYDAKPGAGFMPGGASLHNCMTAHGPDTEAHARATNAQLSPHKYENTMAFMFESALVYVPTTQALHHPKRQADYENCWRGLPTKS